MAAKSRNERAAEPELTNQQIGDVLGVDQRTVRRDKTANAAGSSSDPVNHPTEAANAALPESTVPPLTEASVAGAELALDVAVPEAPKFDRVRIGTAAAGRLVLPSPAARRHGQGQPASSGGKEAKPSAGLDPAPRPSAKAPRGR